MGISTKLQLKLWREPMQAYPMIVESVRHLCPVDHGNDETTIQRWAVNGAIDFDNADHKLYVTDGDLVLGLCAFNDDGKIVANYVMPAGVGMGVGKFMLQSMEGQIANIFRGSGHWPPHAYLDSTATARHFYRKYGYVENGAPKQGAGVSWNHPMIKTM